MGWNAETKQLRVQSFRYIRSPRSPEQSKYIDEPYTYSGYLRRQALYVFLHCSKLDLPVISIICIQLLDRMFLQESLMPYRIYVSDVVKDAEPNLVSGYSYKVWKPSLTSPIPPTLGRSFLLWTFAHYLRMFHNRDYSVLFILNPEGNIVHRSCVIPAISDGLLWAVWICR